MELFLFWETIWQKPQIFLSIDSKITFLEILGKILRQLGHNFWLKDVILVLIIITKKWGKKDQSKCLADVNLIDP